RAAVVEEHVERVGDVTLVDAQAGRAERGAEVQDHVGRGVAKIRREVGGEIGRRQSAERGAAETARRRQYCVGAGNGSRQKRGLPRARGARRAGGLGGGGVRGRPPEGGGGAAPHPRVAVPGGGADGVPGGGRPAVAAREPADAAGAPQRAARI